MTIIIIKYLFLFIIGSVLGWCLEVIYRRYLGKARKWINPGFLSGPFLPIYGNGICLLYIISDLDVNLLVKIGLFVVMTTFVEYVTGLFFIKYYKTRLWDYSQLKYNIEGIIAPLYSFYWLILSLFFYYALYPFFFNRIAFINQHLEFSLFIGIFIGILLVDMTYSFNVISRLKTFTEAAEGNRIIINYEQLKIEIREKFETLTERFEGFEEGIEDKVSGKLATLLRRRQKPTFLLPFKGEYRLMYRLQEHIAKLKNAKKQE